MGAYLDWPGACDHHVILSSWLLVAADKLDIIIIKLYLLYLVAGSAPLEQMALPFLPGNSFTDPTVRGGGEGGRQARMRNEMALLCIIVFFVMFLFGFVLICKYCSLFLLYFKSGNYITI